MTDEGQPPADSPATDPDGVPLDPDRIRPYRLVEYRGGPKPSVELFLAPDDNMALQRALSAAEGPLVELWRGQELVRRWWVGAARAGCN